jgi:hypothetical protein
MVLVKALALGLVAGAVPFALVAVILWWLLVDRFGTVGAVIALVFGGLSGIKWFLASARRYMAEHSAHVMPAPPPRLPHDEAAGWKHDSVPSGPSAAAQLLPTDVTLPVISGRITLSGSDVYFVDDGGDHGRLQLKYVEAEWRVWEGTVVLHLKRHSMGVGYSDLRILDPDVVTWGKRLQDIGVPRTVEESTT